MEVLPVGNGAQCLEADIELLLHPTGGRVPARVGANRAIRRDARSTSATGADTVRWVSVPESAQLADTFAAIARELESAAGPEQTRDVVTHHAVEQVPGCDYAAISLIHRAGTVSSVAATADVAYRVDQIQYETGQRPCLDALRDHVVLNLDDIAHENLDDIAHEQRWPEFVRRATAETGIASMLAFRLFTADDVTGSLNLYSTRPHAFDTHSRAVGTILAAHAAIALLAAGEHETSNNLRGPRWRRAARSARPSAS